MPSAADWIDPMIGLSFAAAATSSIRIATGVLLLPDYNPVQLAEQAATLDSLCGGRFTLGVGIGWSREEFRALGVPFEGRAARTAEYVEVMRALWRDDVASFHCNFVSFDSIRVNPKPLRNRAIPIVVGDNSDYALRRVVAWGDGWYGFNIDGIAAVAERVTALQKLCGEYGRDRRELHVAVALRDLQREDVQQLVDLGVDELVVVDSPPAEAKLAAGWVSTLADRWIPLVAR